MLMAPPIFMQVLVPSILTKPAPYSAHELADLAPFSGSTLPEVAALSDFGTRICSANAALRAAPRQRSGGEILHPAFYRPSPPYQIMAFSSESLRRT